MEGTTIADKTGKVGIRLPISLVKQTDNIAAISQEVHSFEERSNNISAEKMVNDLRQ